MNIKIIASPGGADVLLRITVSDEVYRIVLARHELQELKVAIEKHQSEQPFRVAKEATGTWNVSDSQPKPSVR